MYVSRFHDKQKRLPHESTLRVRCFMTATLDGTTPQYSTDAGFEHDKAVALYNGYVLDEYEYENKLGLSFDEACTIMLQRFREQYPDEAQTSELLVVASALPDLVADSTPAVRALGHLDSLRSGIGIHDAGALTLHESLAVAHALSASQDGVGVIILLIDQGTTLAVNPQVDFSEAPVPTMNHVALIKVEAVLGSRTKLNTSGTTKNALVGRPAVTTGLKSDEAVAKAANDLLNKAAQSGTCQLILDPTLLDLLKQHDFQVPDAMSIVRTIEHGRYATGHISELAQLFHDTEKAPNRIASLAYEKASGRLVLTLWKFAESSIKSEATSVQLAELDEREKLLV